MDRHQELTCQATFFPPIVGITATGPRSSQLLRSLSQRDSVLFRHSSTSPDNIIETVTIRQPSRFVLEKLDDDDAGEP